MKSKLDERDQIWYELLDDRTYQAFYVPADYIRLVPDSELTPISRGAARIQKIVVDLGKQLLTAYQENMVYTSASRGGSFHEGGFATPRGNYHITENAHARHMAAAPANLAVGLICQGCPGSVTSHPMGLPCTAPTGIMIFACHTVMAALI